MSNSDKKFQFKDLVWNVLENLPEKHRDVVSKRFGLGEKERTLESIGENYGITRERVRQIEADALSKLASGETMRHLSPAFEFIHNYLGEHGDVMKEDKLISESANESEKGYLKLLLDFHPEFYRHKESPEFHNRWTRSNPVLAKAENISRKVAARLAKNGKPVSYEETVSIAQNEAKNIFDQKLNEKALLSYVEISNLISKGPFGEFGLKEWSEINPKGVRDKAFIILKRVNKPLHFREVAALINSDIGGRKALDQTVHNELIKDQRFVLVGRGLYALSSWGFEPGTVKDVIAAVLKEKQPLTKDEILKRVMDKRFVKENTILLNLQDNKLFSKSKDGRYSLA